MTPSTDQPLVPARFLFRFSVPLRYDSTLKKGAAGPLAEEYRLWRPGELDQTRSIADVRMAWNEQGIGLSVRVEGKRQPVWCRDSRLEDSDGFQVWIDTRDTHNVHRASRFCHRFVFMPAGGGRTSDQPVADQMTINRARENARPIRPEALTIASEKRVDGYLVHGFIPADALTGFDPAEHPKLGFNYALQDRELGLQTFSVGGGFPYQEDPSLWNTLELVRGE
jgi:hypothetical protein